MSLLNIQIVLKGTITEIDRKILVRVINIIDSGIQDLEDEGYDLDYQNLLEFVTEINIKYASYISIKISDKIRYPSSLGIENIFQTKANKGTSLKLR